MGYPQPKQRKGTSTTDVHELQTSYVLGSTRLWMPPLSPLDKLSSLTGGLVPSNGSNGGVLGEIPVMLGEADINYKVIQVATADSGLVEGNPQAFERIEDSEYFKSASAETQAQLQGKGLYVSRDPVTIDASNATYQNFTNGIMNSEGDAIKNGLTQTGIYDPKTQTVAGAFTVNYNPSHGIVGDLMESGVDKWASPMVGWTTGMAQETGDFVYDVTTARGTEGSNFANHSQGNALMQAGIEYQKDNGGFQPPAYFLDPSLPADSPEQHGTPTVASFGSPVNTDDMGKTVASVGFTYSGAVTHPHDAVGELLGGNKGPNGQMVGAGTLEYMDDLPVVMDYSALFGDNSPHSTYLCKENTNAKCGNLP